MYGDFSRDVEEAPNGYRRVLMQQGRVFLDSDFNDQIGMLLRDQEQLLRVLTTEGALACATTGENCKVEACDDTHVRVNGGRYLVGGLLVTVAEQNVELKTSDQGCLLYLKVWEQSVAAAEDAECAFREPALDGGDTTVRTRVESCVECWPLDVEAYAGFHQDIAREAEAARSELLAKKVKPAPLTLSIPALTVPPEAPNQEAPWRWLTLGFVGVLPPLALTLFDLATGQRPTLFQVAVAIAFVLVAVALVQFDTLPTRVAAQGLKQREELRTYADTVSKAWEGLAATLNTNYQALVNSQNKMYDLMVERLMSERRLHEVTRNFCRKFVDRATQQNRTPPSLCAAFHAEAVHAQDGDGQPRNLKVSGKGEPRYHGAKNQLYRVEIHRGGFAARACFKWSRDNGAALFEVEPETTDASKAQVTIKASHNVSDALRDHWIELLDPTTAEAENGELCRVTEVSWDFVHKTATLTLDPPRTIGAPTCVRVWSQRPTQAQAGQQNAPACPGAIPVANATPEHPYVLEDGLTIHFPTDAATYAAGDYWLIQVRPEHPIRCTSAEEREVISQPRAQVRPGQPTPCTGTARSRRYAYAPLALVTFEGDGPHITDCRLVVPGLGRVSDAFVQKVASWKQPAP
jgi:hypothetical protein